MKAKKAAKRIKKQAAGCDPMWSKIRDQLAKECFSNDALVKGVLNGNLTFSGCSHFIREKARHEAGRSNMVAIATETVYQWARDYYTQNP